MTLDSRPICFRSLRRASSAPGYCTLTATVRPSAHTARCTWPMEAAAAGSGSNERNESRQLGAQFSRQHRVDAGRRHRRSGVLQPGQMRAVRSRHVLGQGRLEEAHRLPELHRSALELTQHPEQLLGGPLLHLLGHHLGRGAAETLAEPERSLDPRNREAGRPSGPRGGRPTGPRNPGPPPCSPFLLGRRARPRPIARPTRLGRAVQDCSSDSRTPDAAAIDASRIVYVGAAISSVAPRVSGRPPPRKLMTWVTAALAAQATTAGDSVAVRRPELGQQAGPCRIGVPAGQVGSSADRTIHRVPPAARRRPRRPRAGQPDGERPGAAGLRRHAVRLQSDSRREP